MQCIFIRLNVEPRKNEFDPSKYSVSLTNRHLSPKEKRKMNFPHTSFLFGLIQKYSRDVDDRINLFQVCSQAREMNHVLVTGLQTCVIETRDQALLPAARTHCPRLVALIIDCLKTFWFAPAIRLLTMTANVSDAMDELAAFGNSGNFWNSGLVGEGGCVAIFQMILKAAQQAGIRSFHWMDYVLAACRNSRSGIVEFIIGQSHNLMITNWEECMMASCETGCLSTFCITFHQAISDPHAYTARGILNQLCERACRARTLCHS